MNTYLPFFLDFYNFKLLIKYNVISSTGNEIINCDSKSIPNPKMHPRSLYGKVFLFQDLAASMVEGDVAKFTDAIKEFDSMTRLVCSAAVPCFILKFQAIGG